MRLLDSPTDAAVQRLRADCASRYGHSVDSVCVVRAPYRLCPLGAHIDHQLGPVSAIAVGHGVLLAFVVQEEPRVDVVSLDYPGSISFPLGTSLQPAGDWADYARGAVVALNRQVRLQRGVSLLIEGHLGEAGLSSSAAVGLGYLLALSQANDLTPDMAELIELDRVIENEFLGLKNGVLDPSAIALARRGHLTIIDCNELTSTHVTQPDEFTFLAVYSGVKESLINSGKFNNRVEECLQAGAILSNRVFGTRKQRAPLGSVTHADWQAHSGLLSDTQDRRARHFFTESERVRKGAEAWRASDRPTFGGLMSASGLSSIHNYETGSPEMIHLYEVLSSSSGVWGARFSGAGFRGCAVALVEAEQVDDILAEVEARYLQRFPQFRDQLWAFTSAAGPGIELL